MDELIEMFAVPDIYADGIGSVEPLSGENFRVTYFAYQRAAGSALLTRVVCARIIRPKSSVVPGAISRMLRELATVSTEGRG